MRYANRMDPLQREAARGAVQQFIAPVHANRDANVLNDHHNVNDNIPPGNNCDALDGLHNVVPLPQPQELGKEDERLLLGEEDKEDEEELPPAPQPAGHAIPVANARAGRRPYHKIARENAEALNALLTRELPQLTNQLQYAMEQMNQLIQRQLDT